VVWLLTSFALVLCEVLLFLAVVAGVAGLQQDLQRELLRVLRLPFGHFFDSFCPCRALPLASAFNALPFGFLPLADSPAFVPVMNLPFGGMRVAVDSGDSYNRGCPRRRSHHLNS
jgi:hypothetical protein